MKASTKLFAVEALREMLNSCKRKSSLANASGDSSAEDFWDQIAKNTAAAIVDLMSAEMAA